MKEPFENNWKQQTDDPAVFQDFIPKDVKSRIEKKLFPSRSILWWKIAFSHAAALLLGILAAWFMVTDSNETRPTGGNIVSQDTRPNDIRVRDIAPAGEKKGSAAEETVVKSIRKPASRENDIKTDVVSHPPLRQKEQQAMVSKDEGPNPAIPLAGDNKPGTEPVSEEPEQQIAVTLPKKKTAIPVSDIAPVSSSMTFTERISQPADPQTASKPQSSPFKIFNR
ncbi:MAG: hypothetical protein KL787_06880 [Taibaiella sp.]|nr:hypothetical protein [Taibaiella sp.]